ncbi:16S rRNA (adenine(1518)-N(6)/adenine(1519)-N(6))-dimethyltransferase RsmA [Coxiella-like endosymbiont]|uniref:16S rRNA (adenine(1518)-N(6)/adenine(1519)-N(6))- dimethyltransferase RsmA n=1 Tax=Coxiella-like endosymbiont TaxID=1592897 RepID=UPI00272CC149|nr:16S rRNA (adenine(1518)-N(6)/adenine(1519)-N(6))-dimethyltransferase RsmA [Coxiella-like endosymbiont]
MNGFHLPRKRFGQHFLKDPIILQKIISAIHPQKKDTIIEIGPGQGALTDFLINEYAKLILVEIDRDLAVSLQNKYALLENLKIYQLDALQFDLSTLETENNSLRIVGNLPYNISTPLLFHLFAQIEFIEDMHFMLQKEVVLRLTAPVGSPNYSRLSLMTRFFCDNTLLFNVPPNAFTPPPKVESAFVRLIPRKTATETIKDLNQFSAVVKEAFTYRRKTISNALKKLIPNEKWKWHIIGINFQSRPQELTVEDFVKISNSLQDS